jgi:translation initiation factor 2B subunit (eIF-2B alpha/beta/delta family)
MIQYIDFDSEVILTLGRSHALLQFLLEAKKKRSFEVFVAEGAPRYHSENLYAYSQSFLLKK